MQSFINLINNIPLQNYEKWFDGIADLLFNQYKIVTSSQEYQLTEIEFYYFNSNHNDETTYGFLKEGIKYKERVLKHKKFQYNQLTWYFHYSGIDITFGTKTNPAGILIRGIKNLQTNEKISGPLVVLLELLNQSTKVNDSIPFILKLDELKNTIHNVYFSKKKRVGIDAGDFKEALYNYSIVTE